MYTRRGGRTMNASSSSNSSTAGSGSTASGAGNRVREYLSSLPLCTLSLLAVNLAVHALVFLGDYEIGPFAFFPYRVLYDLEWYRVFSSAFLHGGLLHIGMNMMSLVALGGMLEPAYGSLRFLYFTWLAIVLEGLLYTSATWLCATVSGDDSYLYSNSIGYSGVLFAYAVVEAFHSPVQSRSVFGCFNVPTKVYPFVLLGLLQIMLPNISFFGHLAGLLAGIVVMTGVGNKLFFPSVACMQWLESNMCCSRVRQLSSYRPVTDKDLVHPYFEARDCQRACVNGFSVLWYAVSSAALLLWNAITALLSIVGVPVDSCGRAISSTWSRFLSILSLPGQALSNLRRGTPSTTNEEGYEAVNTDVQEDVEMGAVPSAPPLPPLSRPAPPVRPSAGPSSYSALSPSPASVVSNPLSATVPSSSSSSLSHSYQQPTIARPPVVPVVDSTANTAVPAPPTRTYNRELSSRLLENFEKNAKLSSANNGSGKSGRPGTAESAKKTTTTTNRPTQI